VIAVLAAALLSLTQTGRADSETADGFYCATAHYFAYETLVHDSTEPHLLHLVSLDDSSGTRAELTIPIAAAWTSGMRCEPDFVAVQGRSATTRVRLDLKAWRAEVRAEADSEQARGSWRWTRLWGTGPWTATAVQRVRLRRFEDGAQGTLEIVRVSSGGPRCWSDAGARIVWSDRAGRETKSRAIFRRNADCARAGLKPSPPIDECTSQPGRTLRRFHGRVSGGGSYSHVAAPFRFELTPEDGSGWRIGVRPLQEDRDLTSMIPTHGRSERDILPDDIRLRWLQRDFHFHPAMRRTIVYDDDAVTMLVDDLRVQAYGRGRLTIDRYSLSKDGAGQPRFDWIEFSGCLSWPR